jgi:hypothetical protein
MIPAVKGLQANILRKFQDLTELGLPLLDYANRHDIKLSKATRTLLANLLMEVTNLLGKLK